MRRFLVFAIVLGLASVMPAATASAVDASTFVRVTAHSDLVGMTEDGGGIYEGTFFANTQEEPAGNGVLTATIYTNADGTSYHGYGAFFSDEDGTTTVDIRGRLLYVIEDEASFTLVYREWMTIVAADNGVYGRGVGVAYVTVSDEGVHVREHLRFAVRYPQ